MKIVTIEVPALRTAHPGARARSSWPPLPKNDAGEREYFRAVLIEADIARSHKAPLRTLCLAPRLDAARIGDGVAGAYGSQPAHIAKPGRQAEFRQIFAKRGSLRSRPIAPVDH